MILCLVLLYLLNAYTIDALNSIDNSVQRINRSCLHSDIDVTFDYQRVAYGFTVDIFKSLVLKHYNYHTIYSPISAWLSLAAFAEGTNERGKEELLLVLGLPQDRCLRQKYYQLALQSENSNNGINITRKRLLAFDEHVYVNRYWTESTSNLITGGSLPLKHNPEASVDVMRKLLGAKISTINLNGNSIILNSFQSHIHWTEAFSNVILKNYPFYNDAGVQVGTVDMMTAKKRVRMSYHPREQTKVIELLIGYNDRYRLMIGLFEGTIRETVTAIRSSFIFDVIDQLKPTKSQVELAIPQFAMTSEIDLKNVFEDIGLKELWNNPSATTNISEPATLPSGIFQRITIVFDNSGINPYKEDNLDIGLEADESYNDPFHGQDFIANKPFMCILIDSKTYSILFATIFSKPTNSFLHK